MRLLPIAVFFLTSGTICPSRRCAAIMSCSGCAAEQNGSGRAAIRGGTVIHPLQLASAMLVLVFATSLFAGTQFFSQQQFGKQRVKPAIQIAALPM